MQEKATYVSVHGLEATKRQVNSLSQQGNLLLKALKTEVATFEVSRLEALVTFLQTRAY